MERMRKEQNDVSFCSIFDNAFAICEIVGELDYPCYLYNEFQNVTRVNTSWSEALDPNTR